MESPRTPSRYFSQEQANESLVYVRAVVGDIVSKWEHILSMKDEERTQHLAGMKEHAQPSSMLEAELLIQEIRYHTRELTALGCYLQDMGKGKVLFPHRQKGYLVWEYGMERVTSENPSPSATNV